MAARVRSVRHRGRRRLLLAGWVMACLLIVGRAATVQLLQGPSWKAAALDQHEQRVSVPAPRGSILDRNGNPLAASNETVRVGVAPRELPAARRAELIALLTSELGLKRATVRALQDPNRAWVEIPGWYPPQVRELLDTLAGVYPRPEWARYYPYERLAKGVLGTIVDGRGRGGIEGAYDAHLRGVAGQEIQAHDSQGQPLPGRSLLLSPPVKGGDVVLTLDRDLQEIGHDALLEAIEETGARGGDLIVSDPKTGEILSLVSLRANGDPALTAINAPYEPGSTLKPFTVAGLLLHGAATLADTVDGEEGRWTVAGRTLTDVHPYGRITLADALRVSSNVGVAKAAIALTPRQQYENLRDFGFGTPTGIELPGEEEGTLWRPSHWSRQSPVSLAIGYEIGVTPIQMVMAYGALANGGRLMEPHVVRELRDPAGRVLHRSSPRVIRQVIPPDVARRITNVLVDVVEAGTGTQAQLATFTVAGKSGTSRAYGSTGYDGHFASFVCFFPVEDPQLLVYVKLDRPEGAYYGGATAAPVTRATMEAVLAARQAPIDREALASLTRRQPRTSPPYSGAQFASSSPSSPPPQARAPRAFPTPETGAVVPDVSGLSPRLAVRRLHALGFRVQLDGPGTPVGTSPRAGTLLSPGDTVRVLTRRVGRE